MDKDKVWKPVSCQLEMVWGCNRRCPFCGIHALHLPLGTYKYMTSDVLVRVAEQINAYAPHLRLEFGTGGESTLHPAFFRNISTLRQLAPNIQIMLQTNGEPWEDSPVSRVKEFWEAGGNIVSFNCYKDGIFDHLAASLNLVGIPWIDYYDSSNKLTIYHNYGRPKSTRMVFLYRNFTDRLVEGKIPPSKWINNQGGATPLAVLEKYGRVKKLPLQAMCTRPYREFIINWDGSMPVCCYDWTDRRIVGNIVQASLQELWEGPEMSAIRATLRSKRRNFSPCDTCDMPGGFRQGIIGASGWEGMSDPRDYLLMLDNSRGM